MKKCSKHSCDIDPLRGDPFYGTRFGEYALIALAIMLNAFLIGFGLLHLAPDGGWLKTVIGLAAATFWGFSLLAALFLILGTVVQIRICLTHRKRRREENPTEKTINP